MRFARAAAIALAASAGLAACGGGSSGPSSYLAAGSREVVFIQWTHGKGDAISGTVTDDTISGTVPNEAVSSQRARFSGTLNGATLTMIISNGIFGGSGMLYGTVAGPTMTLQVPRSGGAIAPGALTSADVSAYNAAVATLTRNINRANTAAPAG